MLSAFFIAAGTETMDRGASPDKEYALKLMADASCVLFPSGASLPCRVLQVLYKVQQQKGRGG